ncbi:MAG: transcription-repair coupling factor, partial [Alphaproteobacteria bacterium]|nr:transcription-repair coupling factor [Alphaproteobacteria bacterium]
MISYFQDWKTTSPGKLWGVPDGADVLALKALADAHNGHAVHIALDDAGLARMRASLELVGISDEQILVFPAWDCLPYDRISPNGIITGQRLSCLADLISAPDAQRIVLTTINAWVQRVPPPSHFADASLRLEVGGILTPMDISQFATRQSYRRADTVREAGEYAIRGSIVDIFPPGADDPVRIDFFDTEIETIKKFDAETQRSTDKINAVTLHPVSEFVLDEDTIAVFRSRYREHFGSDAMRDPLYLSVSEGRHHPGMEQMLPLFHKLLVPLSSYLTNKPVLVDPDVPQAAAQRFAQIDDFYTARREASEEAEKDLI